MRIAILTPTFSGYSGPDRVAWNEVEELSKEHSVTVFCFKADMKHSKAKLIVLGAPKNGTAERIYKLLFFLDILKLSKMVKSLYRYDRVISFLYPMTVPAFLAKMLYNKKYTYYDVGLAPAGLFKSLPEKLYMTLVKFLTFLSVANANDAVSISKFCSNELMALTGIRSKVKYVAINYNRFNKKIDRKKVSNIKKKYGLKGPTLLYVGRISPHKGIHILLKAFSLIQKEYPTAKLLIAGKHTFKSYSQRLKKISTRGVIYTGYVPDEELPFYYGACDVYITASLWEGFNIPAVEAQAIGKKVVAFDVGSHREVVKNGKLVKKGDSQAMANEVIKILRK